MEFIPSFHVIFNQFIECLSHNVKVIDYTASPNSLYLLEIKTYPLILWISLLISPEKMPTNTHFIHYVTIWSHFNQI